MWAFFQFTGSTENTFRFLVSISKISANQRFSEICPRRLIGNDLLHLFASHVHLQILHGLWDKSELQICRFLPTGVLTCSWEVLLLLACIPQVSTHTYMQAWWALALCMTLWVLCALCERCRYLRHSRYMCMGTGSRCMMQVCYSVVVVSCSYVLVDYGTLLCCWALIAPCTLPLCLPVECYSRCRCYVIRVCGTQIWHVYESMVLYICFVAELELFVSNLQLLWEQVLFYAADHRIRDRFSWTQVEFYSMYGFVVLMHAPLVVSWAFLGAWPHLFSSLDTGGSSLKSSCCQMQW